MQPTPLGLKQGPTLAVAPRWQESAGLPKKSEMRTETPRANLVAGMHWLSGVYTKRFNILLLGEKGIHEDSRAGREVFALLMERRRAKEATVDYGWVRRGWFVGSKPFRREPLAAVAQRVGVSNYGAERQESDIQRAERIVRAEIGRLGWAEQDLRSHRKGDEPKVRIARRLRRETTLSLKWIAQRVQAVGHMYRTCCTARQQPRLRPKNNCRRGNSED